MLSWGEHEKSFITSTPDQVGPKTIEYLCCKIMVL